MLISSCSKIGTDTSTGSRAKSTPANTICSQTVSQSSRTGNPSVGKLCLNCELASFHFSFIEKLFGEANPKGKLALLCKLTCSVFPTTAMYYLRRASKAHQSDDRNLHHIAIHVGIHGLNYLFLLDLESGSLLVLRFEKK